MNSKLQVTYKNVVSPLAELEAQQFPLMQSCLFAKLVSTSDDVRKASAEAERRIDGHVLMCRFCLCSCLFIYLFSGHCLPSLLPFPPSNGLVQLIQTYHMSHVRLPLKRNPIDILNSSWLAMSYCWNIVVKMMKPCAFP